MDSEPENNTGLIEWDPTAFTPVGLSPEFREAMSDEELHDSHARVNECHGQILWWRGDIIAERKRRAVKATPGETNMEFDLGLPLEGEVATAFPFEDRYPSLLFEHHREVYSLPADKAKYWLNEADAKGWSVKEMRQHIRESGSEDRFNAPDKPPIAKRFEKLYSEAGRLSRVDPATLSKDELDVVMEILRPVVAWLARAEGQEGGTPT